MNERERNILTEFSLFLSPNLGHVRKKGIEKKKKKEKERNRKKGKKKKRNERKREKKIVVTLRIRQLEAASTVTRSSTLTRPR